MKKFTQFFLLLFIMQVLPGYGQKRTASSPLKKEVLQTIEQNYSALTELSDRIWTFEEIAFEEKKSSKALADYAEELGFKVTRGVAEMPTAFIAEYGSGKPVIGILGEFDALPGLSQDKVPFKSPRNPEAAGHGCGHNLFGVA